uniref:Glutathione S-transferase n=1 Tax=Plectus sambesii TaxID=2011161 RepID=A0A914WRX0_9BILA
MPGQYKLTYFPVRGLGEQIRLLLNDQGIPFEDFQFDRNDWPKIKPTMQFGQTPCLNDGDTQIVQSGAIMRHLARKHNLYGENDCERTYLDMFYEGIKDLHSKYVQLIYVEYEEKKDDFVKNTLPEELAKFEKLLKSKKDGKGFILGDKISFVDYTLFEELDIVQLLDANCLNAFPALKAYHERMHSRSSLQDYLKHREQAKLPVNGNGKQ